MLTNFESTIENTRKYIEHIKLVNEIEKNNKNTNNTNLLKFNEHFKNIKHEKKIFEHKAILINLYGILENTVTEWIKEHVKNIPKIIDHYEELSDLFRERHFDLSIKLVSLIKNNTKYEDLDKEQIVNQLSFNILKPSSFILNEDAYIPQSGNLKFIKIEEALKPLDINLKEKISSRYSHLKKEYEVIFSDIDMLVSLRNEIAHGSNIDNILDITEFEQYIIAVEKVGHLIFEIIEEKENEYLSKFKFIKIDKVVKIHHKKWLEIDLSNQELKIGDEIIIKDTNSYFIKNKIVSIDLEKILYNHLIIKSKSRIWIELDNEISGKKEYFIKVNDIKNQIKYNIIEKSHLIDYYCI